MSSSDDIGPDGPDTSEAKTVGGVGANQELVAVRVPSKADVEAAVENVETIEDRRKPEIPVPTYLDRPEVDLVNAPGFVESNQPPTKDPTLSEFDPFSNEVTITPKAAESSKVGTLLLGILVGALAVAFAIYLFR